MAPLTEGDCYAAFYWRDPGVELQFLERLGRSYELPDDIRVLDIGCGTGRHLPSLSSLGWRVVGMEPHPDYLAMSRLVAAEALATIEVVAGGFGDLEAVGQFDLVLAVGDPWCWRAGSAGPPEGPRIMVAARRGKADRGPGSAGASSTGVSQNDPVPRGIGVSSITPVIGHSLSDGTADAGHGQELLPE